jgi:hypothetical protein
MRDSKTIGRGSSEGALGQRTESRAFSKGESMENVLNNFEYGIREKELYSYQEKNREAVKKHLESLGYEVKAVKRESDGWLDGFRVDRFELTDRRTGEEKVAIGSDDNTSLYEPYDCGGRGLWISDIPLTQSYYHG